MSARNHTECPRCLRVATLRKRRRIKKAKEAYGKVDQKTYSKLVTRAKEPINVGKTLGEYYEWAFDTESGKNVFWLRMHFTCDKCGFSFKFDGTQDVKYAKPKGS